MKVKIIGAGSMGNHLAQASRRKEWEVTVTDNDPEALRRMREEIYPERYGAWDDAIQLFHSDQEPRGGFDIIMIGTPPDVRMPLALRALEEKPRLLHLEKPLCAPDLAGLKEFEQARGKNPAIIVAVGYDNAVGEGVETAAELVRKRIFGDVLTMDVEFREHWRGIFAAHPWLSGPAETYLGYWRRGGGAGGEHSHALHLARYFADAAGWGPFEEVRSLFSIQREGGAEYDELAAFLLKTKEGKVGRVIQDVITYPVKKWIRLQGERGWIEWRGNGVPEGDVARWQLGGENPVERVFPKKRPDDFYREVLHYEKILQGQIVPQDSPLSFERGMEIIKILNEAYYQK